MQLLDWAGRTTWAAALLALGTGACARDAEPRNASDAASSPPATSTTSAVNAGTEQEATVQISAVVRERCNLSTAPQEAPTFAFDDATLRARGKNILDDVARCLTDGPLRDQTITLVGRADERGSEDYNEALGRTRAAAARNYLSQRGVPAERIQLVSRGEIGARGTDEQGYALDRRVDLELGDLRNNPIMQGTMMQSETSATRKRDDKASSYADVAEGGTRVNVSGSSSSSSPSGSATGSSSGSSSGSSATGSASGSVNVGTGSK